MSCLWKDIQMCIHMFVYMCISFGQLQRCSVWPEKCYCSKHVRMEVPFLSCVPALFSVLGGWALISIPTVRGHLLGERIHQNKIEQDSESPTDGTHFPNHVLSKFTTSLLWLWLTLPSKEGRSPIRAPLQLSHVKTLARWILCWTPDVGGSRIPTPF